MLSIISKFVPAEEVGQHRPFGKLTHIIYLFTTILNIALKSVSLWTSNF